MIELSPLSRCSLSKFSKNITFLPPQMFRPLFFVPLAIALVLLQQVLI